MFVTIRKHQSWLWIIIIVLVIISFVWYMGPAGSQGGGVGGGGVYGYVNGEPIGRDRFMEAYTEARLRFFLSTGNWPEESQSARQMFDAEQEVARRLVMLDKLTSLGVWVDDVAVARWIAPLFANRETGVYDPLLYRQFITNVLPRGRVSEEAFRQFARNQVGIQHLMELGAVSGSVVTPREAEMEFRRENEQVTAAVAVFASSNYLAQVEIAPEALETYFNNEAARYRVLDKVRVSYVQFLSSNFVAEAETQMAGNTNLNAQLETLYFQRGTNSFTGTNGMVLSIDAALEQLKGEMRDQLALSLAYRASTAFGEQLLLQYEQEPNQNDHLEKLAGEAELPWGITEPFERFYPPADLRVGPDFGTTAFDLSPAQPMSMEPLMGQDGVYLIALKDRIPGYVPPLDQVRPEVITDFRRSEARRLAREAAAEFEAEARAGIEQSKDFEAICTESEVTMIQPEPFSRSTRSIAGLPTAVSSRQLQLLALEMKTDVLSPVEQTPDGAVLVFVSAREPVAEERVKTELADFTDQLRSSRRMEAITEWTRKEMELAQVSGLPEELRGNAGP
jgi:hypothetical protein